MLINTLILPNKLRLLFLCLVASSFVGEENVMSCVSERSLSQLNVIKVAPTQA